MKQGLKTKDYILTGIFSILIFIINSAVGTVLTPFMAPVMPLISGVCLFFSAIVFMIMAIKVSKRGVLLILGAITGLFYLIMGVPMMLPFFILSGLLGEAVLLAGDGSQYRNITRQSLAYALYGALYGLGGYVTVYIYGRKYLESMFTPEMGHSMYNFAYSYLWMIGCFIFSFILALLGCAFSTKLLKKHFIKAGVI